MTWVFLATAVSAAILPVAVVAFLESRFEAYHRHKGASIRRGPRLRYHAGEVAAALQLTWWYLRGAFRDGLVHPPQVAGVPVLCVHGYTQNGTNFWGLRQQLHALGRPTRAVTLGLPPRSLEAYARRLASALAEVAEHGPVDIVAHSMGGMVLRVALAEHPHLARRVRRIVTLGSPHRGTASPRGLPVPGREVAQMRRRSKFLQALPGFSESAPQAEVTTVAARRDLLVYPATSSLLPGSRHVELDGVGHIGLLTNRAAVAVVVAALTA